MLTIYLVRHGETKGNILKQFSGGKTDEPVTQKGQEELCARDYPEVEQVYTSPMLRCRQTSCLAFGVEAPVVIDSFRECNFGMLEGKTHAEMAGDPVYEAFLKGGAEAVFPGGESIRDFSKRCLEGLKEVVADCVTHGYKKVACTVHGGTIMSLLYEISVEKKQYYDWRCRNGEGYEIETDEEKWQEGRYDAAVVNRVGSRISA